MKKLIFRNILSEILLFLLVAIFSLTVIIWVIQAVNYLDLVSEDGHSFEIYFKFSILSIPKIFSRILIFVIFISIFYIISKYEDNNEILIFWTNGVKKIELINSILKLSIILILFQLFLNIFIVPKTLDLGRKYIKSSGIEMFPSLLKEKQFIDIVSNLTMFIDKKKSSEEFEKVFLKDEFDGNKSRIIIAKKGIIKSKDNNYYLNLYDGKMLNLEKKNSNIIEFSKSEINLSLYSTKTTTFPKIQEIESFEILECLKSFYFNKKNYMKPNFECSDGSIESVNKEFFKRFINPFYILLVGFVAASLILKSKDDKNYLKYKYLLFFLGIVIIVLSEISGEYLNFRTLFNSALVFMPFLISLILYLGLMKSNFKISRAS